MKCTILGCGTSTGVPIPGCRCAVCSSDDPRNSRLRTSAWLQLDGRSILIDTSTDLRAQALRYGIVRVDAVLFTHSHADHILGLEDLRAFNFIQRASIPCYAAPETAAEIRTMFSYVFTPDPAYEGGMPPRIEMHEFTQPGPITLLGRTIDVFPLRHGRMTVSGFRIGSFAYATDCNGIPDESLPYLSGLETLVLDGLRFEPHRTHFTIPEAIETAKRLGAKRTYLTHMSHTVDYVEVSRTLPDGIELAYDGLEIELS